MLYKNYAKIVYHFHNLKYKISWMIILYTPQSAHLPTYITYGTLNMIFSVIYYL